VIIGFSRKALLHGVGVLVGSGVERDESLGTVPQMGLLHQLLVIITDAYSALM
jgi:hypothetical protein